MTQEEALTILKTGANVFLTGEPGAGKTHTVNRYTSYLRGQGIEPAITASTGIAATHIGGMTIHSWSGIGIKNKLDAYDIDKIASNEYISKRIQKTKVLIIDEVSMLHADTLSMVDAVCRSVKMNDEAFGGMQVILVGDFFQLPPIQKRTNEIEDPSMFEEEQVAPFAYTSPAWSRLAPVACYITEQYRQEDGDFLDLLSAIRRGDVTEENMKHIEARSVFYDDAPEHATKLFSHNADVDRLNAEALSHLPGEVRNFTTTSTGSDALVAMIKKGCLSPENLALKTGALVMFTKNNPTKGFVNGTLGTVVRFEKETWYPVVEVAGDKLITVEPMDWSIEENGKVKASIAQVPLRLAWAITVHKSQGMSLDCAVMDLSGVFEYGQGYVALSRVRKLSGLYLLGINDQALRVHPEVLEKDIEFRTRSEEAREAFSKISPADLEKMHENFAVASGGYAKSKKSKKKDPSTGSINSLQASSGQENKKEKVKGDGFAKLRETYPNAYRPWKSEDDEKLKELFLENMSAKNLSKEFGRQRGSIRARLVKLGLVEE